MSNYKTYLGDSVYADVGSHIGEVILTTENGYPTDPSNTIVLGVREMMLLAVWNARAIDALNKERDGTSQSGS